jgi:beta-N-acetylhexosaminidase
MAENQTAHEKMAGQMLMLGFDGLELNKSLKHIINDLKAGGVILFKRNIDTPEQVKTLCRDCQAYAKKCKSPPLFIAIDQEGGTVARLKAPFTLFKGNPFIQTPADARNFAVITAQELLSIGVNMNLAPVLDVVPDTVDSIMKDRAFKGDADAVSTLGMEVILTLQENNIMAVAKHFPGIGRTVKDSHFFLPVLDTDLETLKKSDMLPFAAAKDSVAGIMLSHILYSSLDSQWSASLSQVIVRTLLRDQIGYNGLVMTDDLDMKAIDHDIETCICQILIAGVDMALVCHEGPNMDKAFHELVRHFETDAAMRKQGKESVDRIIRLKKRFLGSKISFDF